MISPVLRNTDHPKGVGKVFTNNDCVMADTIIEVEDLSKMYRLGTIGRGTISSDIGQWWKGLTNKKGASGHIHLDDPAATGLPPEYIWSLRDINFNVHHGEIVGIIGKNGAGKSTLLKILSGITKPTRGTVRIDGRLASMLEVGTGFHPELTGRENVFLNGAILGMTKQEIRQKFDDIVAFSGVESFIDTPVKRYSSGMYVRLAFSVSVFLEPDILFIDEVLAVGDADFQMKCLAKIKEIVYQDGCTVLFVSHSITAVKQLCHSALYLEKGRQVAFGDTATVLSAYQEEKGDRLAGWRGQTPKDADGHFTDWNLEETSSGNPHSSLSRSSMVFSIGFDSEKELEACEIRLMITYEGSQRLVHTTSYDEGRQHLHIGKGRHRFRFSMNLPVRADQYHLEMILYSLGKVVDQWHSTTPLTILDNFDTHVEAGILTPAIRFMHLTPDKAGVPYLAPTR